MSVIPNAPLETDRGEEYVTVPRAAVMLGLSEDYIRKCLRKKSIVGEWREEFGQWQIKRKNVKKPEPVKRGRKRKQ